jgi:hypothetical protein
MDEISLNIARRHRRSPLVSGENTKLKKASRPEVSGFSKEEMWRVQQKKRCSVRCLDAKRRAVRLLRIAGRSFETAFL